LRTRFYEPGVGRFLTRDMWDGDLQEPVSYNKWLYGYGNPINLTDPTGKYPLASFANHNGNPPSLPDFTLEEKNLIEMALRDVAIAYLRVYDPYEQLFPCGTIGTSAYVHHIIRRYGATAAFYRIHGGPITFEKWTEHDRYSQDVGETTPGQASTKAKIFIFQFGKRHGGYARLDRIDPTLGEITSQQYCYFNTRDDECYKNFIVHEVGHAFDNALTLLPNGARTAQSTTYLVSDLLTPNVTDYGFAGNQDPGCWQRRANNITNNWELAEEIFADQFVGWVYNRWEVNRDRLTVLGQARSSFMDRNMSIWVNELLGSQ
jgi:hypothetical protein